MFCDYNGLDNAIEIMGSTHIREELVTIYQIQGDSHLELKPDTELRSGPMYRFISGILTGLRNRLNELHLNNLENFIQRFSNYLYHILIKSLPQELLCYLGIALYHFI